MPLRPSSEKWCKMTNGAVATPRSGRPKNRSKGKCSLDSIRRGPVARLLNRTTFETSRLLDFCSEKELTAQTGHDPEEWPLVILKELLDNALDACEEAGVPPTSNVVAEQAALPKNLTGSIRKALKADRTQPWDQAISVIAAANCKKRRTQKSNSACSKPTREGDE